MAGTLWSPARALAVLLALSSSSCAESRWEPISTSTPIQSGPEAPSGPIAQPDEVPDAARPPEPERPPPFAPEAEPPIESLQPEPAPQVPEDDDAGAEYPAEVFIPVPRPANDLAYPCGRDADCNFDACYVPGTGENPICSKRCDSDADCPEGALCAGPLECTDGIGCEGFGYCFRSCETNLDCAPYNPNGLPTEELPWELNSVTCVDWRSRPLCIQHSEP